MEQLLQRHLLFRNTLQERLSAEHWKSLVGDILVQLIGQNDASGCFPFSFGTQTEQTKQQQQKKTLNTEEAHGCCCCCVVFQASFSDMYIGYTSTLASFLSLEFNRLNQSDDSEKTQVGHSAGASVSCEAPQSADW